MINFNSLGIYSNSKFLCLSYLFMVSKYIKPKLTELVVSIHTYVLSTERA